VTGAEVTLRCDSLRRDAELLLASSILDNLEPPFSGDDELLFETSKDRDCDFDRPPSCSELDPLLFDVKDDLKREEIKGVSHEEGRSRETGFAEDRPSRSS
jgi:hypothetical protein